MKRLHPTLLHVFALATTLALGARVEASPPGGSNAAIARPSGWRDRTRMQPLTRARLRSAPVGVRLTARGVARVGRCATGFLVWRDPTSRRALMLTNYHVAGGDNFVADEALTFSDARRGATRRVIASSPTLDYALVEIELPEASTARPVPLRRSGMVGHERVYSISAYASLRVRGEPGEAIAIDRDSQRLVELGTRRGAPTIQYTRLPADVRPVAVTAGRQQERGVLTRMPNRPGGSGSPVVAMSDHRVVGLHSSGGGRAAPWESTEIPIDHILRDIARAVDRGDVPAASRDGVESLLERAHAR